MRIFDKCHFTDSLRSDLVKLNRIQELTSPIAEYMIEATNEYIASLTAKTDNHNALADEAAVALAASKLEAEQLQLENARLRAQLESVQIDTSYHRT